MPKKKRTTLSARGGLTSRKRTSGGSASATITLTRAANGVVSEQHTATLNSATGGTWRMRHQDISATWMGPFAHNVSAATIGAFDMGGYLVSDCVTVTGSNGGPFVIDFAPYYGTASSSQSWEVDYSSLT